MKIHLETGGSTNMIRAYAAGRVTVNDKTYTTSLIVTPSRVITDWPPGAPGDLALSDVETIGALQPEVVILGTGRRLAFPEPGLLQPLRSARIGCEVMDTPAACRTYNILMAEGRNVVAALFMIAE